ncbi:MAG: MarR family transcriptional regulator [Elusimicrobia bacterium]|nr:MarR family transcriptional regulator [Elusimicrobiota bacterium]
MERRHVYSPAEELDLKMVIALLRTVKALEAGLAPCFGGWGVTPAQFGVLEFLYHKGPARISAIIERTLSSGGNMTVVVRNLERSGLVRRRRDDKDGRAALVELTPRGERLMSSLFPEHLEVLRKFFAPLGEGEKHGVIAALKALGGR